jgi:hypothetical protein
MIYVRHVARMEVEILVGNFKLAILKYRDHFEYFLIHGLIVLMLYYV